jgi:hypothetical protein
LHDGEKMTDIEQKTPKGILELNLPNMNVSPEPNEQTIILVPPTWS